MKQLILVFIGGGLGSVLRFVISKLLNNSPNEIPYGTFTVNILGCFLIGIILSLAAKNNTLTQNHVTLLAAGFCGGFTTFSTFIYESNTFFKAGDFTYFALYTIGSFVIGFFALFLGMSLIK